MELLDKLKQIPIINDHTHIFGCGAPEYEKAGEYVNSITPENMIAQLSCMNMDETASVAVSGNKVELAKLWIELFKGRRTTFPVRASIKMFKDFFGFCCDDLNTENMDQLVEILKEKLPSETEELYKYIGSLSNTEVWFCNHGNFGSYDERTTKGQFRWVPYFDYFTNDSINKAAEAFGLERPSTVERMREVLIKCVKQIKTMGAVAIKGGAFAYELGRPFAPDISNLGRAEAAKERLDLGKGDKSDCIILQDTLTILCAEAAGMEGIPVQIHVGLIWTASGPTRIPEVMELAPLFYYLPDTVFVVFHAGYPKPDDLAYLAATMSNVRAELNWAPFWTGSEFPELIGKWIEMVPNDRILYGTDGMGLTTLTHDMVMRESLAEALELRIRKGYLTERAGLQLAANILRNNAIDTYGLDLPKFQF